MRSVYEFDDFRNLIRVKLTELPRSGRGQLEVLGKLLGKHPSQLSHFLNGTKSLSEDEIYRIYEHLGLAPEEIRYAMLLVQYDRATHPNLRKLLKKSLSRLKEAAIEYEQSDSCELNEQQRAVFYSSWYFSAVRLLSSVPETQTYEAIAHHLKLPMDRIEQIAEFLVQTGLCKQIAKNRIEIGIKHTVVDKRSLFLSRHHTNWRLKAIEEIPKARSENMFFTAPVSISLKDADKVRAILSRVMDEVSSIVDPSPAEAVFYLGIDWMKL